MIETYKEFTFEAAHAVPPHSGLHGHTFKVSLFMRGEPDPVFGWPANLYEVEQAIEGVRKTLDHSYLNDIDGMPIPSLENLARWIWDSLRPSLPGLDRIELSRGPDGQKEGCTYSARP